MRNMRLTRTVIFQSILICQTIPLKICQFLVSSSLLQTALNAKHWKSVSFSNLPHFILLDLTNNLITYSSFLMALHFFSILAPFLLFSFYFVSSCLHFLSLLHHHYSFAFEFYLSNLLFLYYSRSTNLTSLDNGLISKRRVENNSAQGTIYFIQICRRVPSPRKCPCLVRGQFCDRPWKF